MNDDGRCNTWNAICHEVGDRVLFMDEGVIVEENNPEKIFTKTESERSKYF